MGCRRDLQFSSPADHAVGRAWNKKSPSIHPTLPLAQDEFAGELREQGALCKPRGSVAVSHTAPPGFRDAVSAATGNDVTLG